MSGRSWPALLAWPVVMLGLACAPVRAPSASAGGCDQGHPGIEKRTVRLQSKPAGPSLYYRTQDFVVFIPSAVVLEALKPNDDLPNIAAHELSEQLRARLPLREDQDLFQFVISHWSLWKITRSVVVEAIEKGNAAISNEGGVWSREVRVVRDRAPGHSFVDIYEGETNGVIIQHIECSWD